MCRAFDRTIHSDCFQCSTCGSSLKNQGHHFINDKFYCDIHGRQLRGGNNVARRDETHWSTARRPKMIPTSDKDTLLTPYQPDVSTRQSISISPTPWKTQSPISPSNRGVPPAATQYGHELNELRKEIYSSSMSSDLISINYLRQSLFHNLVKRPLCTSVIVFTQEVTSPGRLPCKHRWLPESHKIKRYWQCSYLIAAASKDSTFGEPEQELLLPLSKFIKENVDKKQKLPSPKRYLLRGELKSHLKLINHLGKNRITENNLDMGCRYHLISCDIFYQNPNYPEHMEQQNCFFDKPSCDVEQMDKEHIVGLINNMNSRICSYECDSLLIVEWYQRIRTSQTWVTTPRNNDHNTANSKIRECERMEYEKEEHNLRESDMGVVDTSSSTEMRNFPIKEISDGQALPNRT
uniref:LIM zinc-binding domain-containing protein n=1 Tax=Loa loa TaxID=7209 RepID=A0A1I7VA53_LOALO